ncbi:unnamed protein product [Urochloa decumbens]|uniref:F-box domain-containing protein n=1 Tax=Urochloa decumbens TaxID=240449 RepID=A0ABC9GRC5_9POAL
MAPPRLPPELIHDVAEEILLRVRPDEPADLVRASAVCKAWLRIVSEPAFLRRYRAFHRSAPLLGFLYQAPELWHTFYSAVVLCAVAGCDHRDCRNGPFLVVYVGKDDLGNSICAYVYSSEAHAWGTPVYAHLEDDVYFSGTDRAALVGDAIYWTVALGDRILKGLPV